MRHALAACVLLLAASQARSQSTNMKAGHNFGITPSPTDLTWELRTAAGQSVSWSLTGLMAAGAQPGQIATLVYEDQAAAYGIDWNAWSAAVVNPDFNRSLVTWGGVTQELPWPAGRVSPFVMDRLQIFVDEWAWPTWPQVQFGSRHVRISVWAVDEVVVPEPATWIMLCVGLLHVLTGRTSGRR